MMRSRPSRFQRGGSRPGTRPVPVLRSPATPTPVPAREPRPAPVQPPSDIPEDLAPALIAAPEETDTGSIPVVPEPQRAAGPAPKPVSRSANLQNLEALLKESKRALVERDEALAKVAELETRIEELSSSQSRAGELQDQLAAVMAERDSNAESLAEAQRQVEALKPFEAEVAELKQKLAASERSRAKIAHEHPKLKSRLATLEKQLKELMDHLKASEGRRRKAETALANAKEIRNEYLFRIQAIQAIAQGDSPPSRSRITAQVEQEEAAEAAGASDGDE